MNSRPPNSSDDRPGIQLPVERVMVALPTAKPWATYVLVVINVAVFVIQSITTTLNQTDPLLELGAFSSKLVLAGQFWRLITAGFLHLSLLHIGLNMYGLYIIGRSLENFFGRRRFVIMYLLGLMAGNVVSFLFNVPVSAGAGAGLMGLLAAYTLFVDQNRFLFGDRAKPMVITALVFVVLNVVLGMLPGMNNIGSIGGMVGGALYAWLAGPLMHLEGVPPTLTITDQRNKTQIWVVGVAELAVLMVLTAVPFLR